MNTLLNSYFVKTHRLEISITIIAIVLFLIYFLGAPHVFTRFPIYPLGALTPEAAFDAFQKQASALADGGVDMLWVETMSSTEEVDAAVKAAKTTGLLVAVTMTFDTASRTMMGITPAQFAEQAVALGVDVLGANCGMLNVLTISSGFMTVFCKRVPT